jgi:hypothetical protein
MVMTRKQLVEAAINDPAAGQHPGPFPWWPNAGDCTRRPSLGSSQT